MAEESPSSQQTGGRRITGDARITAAFGGTAGEYFRIWSVNTLLTVITIGIYSPWAKVRNKRYFYGSTTIAGANFEYHANPLAILIARVVLLSLLVAGGYWVGGDDFRDAGYSLILAVVLPWALVRGLAFNARNSSWAGVRFSFKCDFIPIYLIYSPMLILNGFFFYELLADGLFLHPDSEEVRDIIWAALGAVFIFSLPPLVRAYHLYKAGRHKLGNLRFYLHKPPVLAYYGALVAPFLCVSGFVFLALLLAGFVAEKTGAGGMSDIYIGVAGFVIGLVAMVLFMQFSQAALFRLFWGNLRAENDNFAARFVCRMNVWHFAFNILLVNAAATILSFGFLHPWAKVRKTKYLVRHLHIVAPPAALAAAAGRQESPFGEEVEVAEGFDFDVGLV